MPPVSAEARRIRSVVQVPGFHFVDHGLGLRSRGKCVVPEEIKVIFRAWTSDMETLERNRRVFLTYIRLVFMAAADFFSVEGYDAEKGWLSIPEAAPSIADRATESVRFNRLLQGNTTPFFRPIISEDIKGAMVYAHLRQLYLDRAPTRQSPESEALDQAQRQEYGCEDLLALLYQSIDDYYRVKSHCDGHVRDILRTQRLGFDRQAEFDANGRRPMYHIRASLELKDKELEELKLKVARLEEELKSKDQNIEEERQELKRKLAVSQDQHESMRKRFRSLLEEEDALHGAAERS